MRLFWRTPFHEELRLVLVSDPLSGWLEHNYARALRATRTWSTGQDYAKYHARHGLANESSTFPSRCWYGESRLQGRTTDPLRKEPTVDTHRARRHPPLTRKGQCKIVLCRHVHKNGSASFPALESAINQ